MQILSSLKMGNYLTDNDARDQFNCNRLSGRILDIRKLGHHVTTAMVRTKTKKDIGLYFMTQCIENGILNECKKRGFILLSFKQ